MNQKLLKIKTMLASLIDEEGEGETKVEIKAEAITSDKGVLYIEKIEEGQYVETGDENGENRTKAEDGDYLLDDGRTIQVKDGKIEAIIEKEEEETEEENKELEEFRKVKAVYEATYDEKLRAMYDALALLYQDAYIVEAGDDHLVACVYVPAEGKEKCYKHSVVFNEDGTVSLGEAVEVKSTYVPVEEKTEEVEEETETKEEVETEMEKTEKAEEEVEVKAEEEEVEDPENTKEETDTEAIVKLREEVDELFKIVDELKKKLEKVEGEETKTPQEEYEAITAPSKMSKAELYAAALRK